MSSPNSPRPSFATVLVASTALLASPSAVAQKYISSPAEPVPFVGNGSFGHLGRSPDGRHMILDGEIRGTSRSLKAVAMRRAPTPSKVTLRGRSWKNVRLTMSEGLFGVAWSPFSSNQLTPPVTVFSSAVSWPTYTTNGLVAPYGGASGEYAFPFKSPWLYSGKRDVCLDFDFTGGKLQKMSGGSSVWTPYALSGRPRKAGKLAVVGGTTNYGTGCVDSSQTVAASVTMRISTFYNGNTNIPGLGFVKDQILVWPSYVRIGTDTTGYKGYAAAIHLIGLAGKPAGTAVPGFGCGKLHLDLSKPHLQFVPPQFRGGIHGLPPSLRGTFNRQLVGTKLWYQAAWTDSRTAQTLLTNAVSTQIADQSNPSRRVCLYQDDPKLKSGSPAAFAVDPIQFMRYRL